MTGVEQWELKISFLSQNDISIKDRNYLTFFRLTKPNAQSNMLINPNLIGYKYNKNIKNPLERMQY